MEILDTLKKVTGGAGTLDVESDFDKISTALPTNTLAQGLTHAFNSNETPPFAQMLSGLFSKSNPDQKAGLLNQVIGTLGAPNATQLASGAGLTNLANVISGGTITPQQAEKIAPNDVQILAQNAVKTNPSIVETASNFYAQHPTLVKSIGAGALALLMSKISQIRK